MDCILGSYLPADKGQDWKSHFLLRVCLFPHMFKFHIDRSNLLLASEKQHLRRAGSQDMHKFVTDFIGREDKIEIRIRKGAELHDMFREDEKRLFGVEMQA